MSTLKISKGKRNTAIRAVIYGTEGVGKSTIGSQLPRPLFLDVEGSTNQLDVDRIDITSWTNLSATLASLAGNPEGYRSIIVDTADWAERLCAEDLLRRTGKKSIEEFGFGKGYTHLAEEFSRTLTLCDGLISKGVNVVWIAHSKVVRLSPPDQTDGFDRYELKLSKQIAPLLKEWSDLLLFAKFQLKIVEGGDGRLKAQGGKERVIYTTNSAAWDAKNRYGLADSIILGNGIPREISAIFEGVAAQSAPKVEAQPAQKAPAPKPEPVEVPAPVAPINEEQLSKLTQYNKVTICAEIINKALAHYDEASIDLLTEAQAAKVITRCQEEMNASAVKPEPAPAPQKAGGFPWPASLLSWLEANEAAVNAYLTGIKWVQPGQTFRDLSDEHAEAIALKPEGFARAAKIQPMKEAA